MAEITVRDGTAADREFVLDMARRCAAFGPPPWRDPRDVVAGEVRTLERFFAGRLDGPALLIAEQAGGDRLGFVFLERTVDYFTAEAHGHIGMIAVAERAEGLGAGAVLMRAAEAWARSSGYATLTLNVFEGNARARALYERSGYRVEILRYTKAIAPRPE